MQHYLPVLPDLFIAVGATLVLLMGPLREGRNLREFLRWVSLLIVGTTAALLVAVNRGADAGLVADGWLTTAPLHVAFGVV